LQSLIKPKAYHTPISKSLFTIAYCILPSDGRTNVL